jgi:hypothetical protein
MVKDCVTTDSVCDVHVHDTTVCEVVIVVAVVTVVLQSRSPVKQSVLQQ